MSNIRDLLAKAQSKSVKTESAKKFETNSFDDLEDFMDGVSTNSLPSNFNKGLTKDGQKLEIGDPVVGVHRGQRMSGQVIAIQDEIATVEWKDRETTRIKTAALELSNVDDDYEEETMYLESTEPNMGFDKESFVEDTDLESLLRGGADGASAGTVYGNISDRL